MDSTNAPRTPQQWTVEDWNRQADKIIGHGLHHLRFEAPMQALVEARMAANGHEMNAGMGAEVIGELQERVTALEGLLSRFLLGIEQGETLRMDARKALHG